MILLFQPEIRHAIESIGRGDLRRFNIFSSRNKDYNDDEIENPTAEDFERFHQQILAYLKKEDPNYKPRSFEEYAEELRKAFEE